MRKAYIRQIEYYLPKNVLTNEDLAAQFGNWSAEQIHKKTGINTRHIAAPDETSLDLAEHACELLFAHSVLIREQVDFLIMVTQSPDYILPPSSCLLQNRLHLSEQVGAFDINLGCSAYPYGLMIAKGLIASGTAQNVLLVTAETYSKFIHPKDKSTRTLFGDAATVTWIGTEGTISLGEVDYGTNGADGDKLMIPAGMMREPLSEASNVESSDENGYVRSPKNLYMDGSGIFNFSIEMVPLTVSRVLKKANISIDDIALFIFHQANEFMLSYLRKKLHIPKERFYMDFADIGNTVSCSIPIAVRRSMEQGAFPTCGNVLLTGFGVGLSWSSIILQLEGKQ